VKTSKISAAEAKTLYTFDPDHPPVEPRLRKADPQKIGDALDKVSKSHGGKLDAPDVVEAAKPKDHVLHPLFDWSDKVAAEQWRLSQARQIIRSIRIVRMDDDEPLYPAYVSITAKDGRSYRHTNEVLTSRDLQEKVLISAERELQAFERRYSRLLDVCELIRAARQALFNKRTGKPPGSTPDDENRPGAPS
jgi:hypothetical protein